MTLRSLIAACTLTMSSLSAFAATASFTHQSESSHMILLGLGMMAVIVWRRVKSNSL